MSASEAINLSTVDILRTALQRAEAGEITDVAIACLYADGDTGSLANATDQKAKRIGAVHLLLRDLCQDNEEELHPCTA